MDQVVRQRALGKFDPSVASTMDAFVHTQCVWFFFFFCNLFAFLFCFVVVAVAVAVVVVEQNCLSLIVQWGGW
jgi:hypothetical protein